MTPKDAPKPPPRPAPPAGLLQLLRGRGVRDAVILSEVLGPPVALRP